MQIGNHVLPRLPPQPKTKKFPSLNLASETLPAHNASLQSLLPSASARPNGNFMPNIPVVKVPQAKTGAENFIPTLATNHSVQESFGGSPRWEAEQSTNMPINPRMFSNAPKVKVDFGPRHIPIRETPVLPKANIPNMPNLSGRVQKAEPISLELKAVTPSIKVPDLGGLTSSTSKFGGIGQSTGRSFGAESFMTGF